MSTRSMIGIYKIKPSTGSNMATIKWKYNIDAPSCEDEEAKVGDDPMEFDTSSQEIEQVGKNTLLVDVAFGTYQVTAKMFVCNIQNKYITSLTEKYPIYYMTYLYDKKFVSGKIVNYCLYFNLDEQSKQVMMDLKTCIGKTLTGYITLEFVDDEDTIKKYLGFVKTNKEEQLLKELMIAKLDTQDIGTKVLGENEMIEIVEEMQVIMHKFMEPYNNFFKPIKLDNFMTRSHVVENYCKSQVKSDMIKNYIKFVLEDREKERMKQYNFKYDLPKRIFDLAKIRENPELVDSMLNDRDLDRSSDSDD